jgi:hypothetical protein
MTNLIKWLGNVSFPKLFVVYCLVSVIVVVISIFAFLPLLLIYSMLGMEFPNLGPIATFVWGVLFDIFVVTPLFFILFIIKIFRR